MFAGVELKRQRMDRKKRPKDRSRVKQIKRRKYTDFSKTPVSLLSYSQNDFDLIRPTVKVSNKINNLLAFVIYEHDKVSY